jgi:hypothetical protein
MKPHARARSTAKIANGSGRSFEQRRDRALIAIAGNDQALRAIVAEHHHPERTAS